MVGYNEKSEKHLSDTEYGIAGGIAGSVTRGVTQPLDVIKIRLQLQVELIKKCNGSKYWGVLQATRTIICEEGASALWKGHVPAQWLSIVYGLCQTTAFEVLTREAWNLAPELRDDEYRPVVHFICGAAAGVISSVVSFPFDIVRTRLVAQGEPKIYRGMFHALLKILRSEGPNGLFRGLSPVLLQMAPHTGIQFSLYTLMQKLWVHIEGEDNQSQAPSVSSSLVTGALAGIGAKTFVYPLDLTKKRLQMVGFEEARAGFGQTFTTSGPLHCLKKIVYTEGVTALYKGLWPSILKSGVVTALYFTIYENVCSFMLHSHQ